MLGIMVGTRDTRQAMEMGMPTIPEGSAITSAHSLPPGNNLSG